MDTVTVKFVVNGQDVGMMIVNPKVFKTGSKGLFANGKVNLGDGAPKGYQVQVQLVEIGSKPPTEK